MKWTIPLVLLCGLLVSMCAHADDVKGTHPRWVIVLTITDPTTGELLEQGELDPELEYDDPIKCKPSYTHGGKPCRRPDVSQG